MGGGGHRGGATGQGPAGLTAPTLVGTWRLASYESRDGAGAVQYPFGQGAIGQLTYDASGNMSAMLMKPNRPPFASQDMRSGTDSEVRDAFDGFIAYFGRYTVDPAKRTVTHHVQGAFLSRPLQSVLVWERVG